MEWKWKVDGRVLSIVEPDGRTTSPTAEQVYSTLVQRAAFHPSVPTMQSEVQVSRYPLAPSVAIRDPSGEGIPTIVLEGTSRGRTIELEVDDLERGHLVVDRNWFPIEPVLASQVLDVLRSYDLEPRRTPKLRSFLELRRRADDGLVVDGLSARKISPLAFTPPGKSSPQGIVGTLYPYQAAGWRWLSFLINEGAGGLLADEMGLGKTLQIIGALTDNGEGKSCPALIVAPGSLLENWRREFLKFSPEMKVLKHHGHTRTGRPAELLAYDVVVTSYDSVVRDSGLFAMIDWKVVVLDEAQYVRNPAAQRTKAVKSLPRRAGLAVTGTPVENRLLDLWSIMDFVLPGQLGTSNDFQDQFAEDVDGAAALEPLVSPLMLRRRLSEVAQDLPPRIDIPQVIQLEPEEAQAYEAIREKISRDYGTAATFVALTSMRRFCSHPSLVDSDELPHDALTFSKFRRLDELISEIFSLGDKVLVFTSFTGMADMIADHVRKNFGAFTGVIDGRLDIDRRQPLIDEFSAVAGSAALILNPKAGGAGLNITAANHVIHYNPEWNPALEDQASARAHRRGQLQPVTVHRLIIANTVEDVIDERLARKRQVFDAAVVGVTGNEDDYGDIVEALSRSPLGEK